MVRTSNTHRRSRTDATRVAVESLESRQLLSAATVNIIITPNLKITSAATTAKFSGYTPAQIRAAYGFNQISGDGTGQTIGIVDAYDDPNIAADLKAFDAKYGLKDSTLIKISQTGGSTSKVQANKSWSSEIALDVEWAHAIAPGATIVLVEANSDSFTDLTAAVNTARNYAGVSVVSMSWGSSEFWGQSSYDSIFTTPSGHQGVTFVAASGDQGSAWGPEWPATSPNVLSVGGTTLNLTSSGTYSSETGWNYSTGGISRMTPEPSYQYSVQSTGARTSPDVSYDANPSTGVAVYDSYGSGGWTVYGGTSAGAPQWAALIALANQARVTAGKGTLDGVTGTLPALYRLYSAPGSSSYSTYTANFNDIVTGRSSFFTTATAGYDLVTGLGSPKAAAVVSALASSSITASTSTTTTTTTTRSSPYRPTRVWRWLATANGTSDYDTQSAYDIAEGRALILTAAGAPRVFDALVNAEPARSTAPTQLALANDAWGERRVTTSAMEDGAPVAQLVGTRTVLPAESTVTTIAYTTNVTAATTSRSSAPTLNGMKRMSETAVAGFVGSAHGWARTTWAAAIGAVMAAGAALAVWLPRRSARPRRHPAGNGPAGMQEISPEESAGSAEQ